MHLPVFESHGNSRLDMAGQSRKTDLRAVGG